MVGTEAPPCWVSVGPGAGLRRPGREARGRATWRRTGRRRLPGPLAPRGGQHRAPPPRNQLTWVGPLKSAWTDRQTDVWGHRTDFGLQSAGSRGRRAPGGGGGGAGGFQTPPRPPHSCPRAPRTPPSAPGPALQVQPQDPSHARQPGGANPLAAWVPSHGGHGAPPRKGQAASHPLTAGLALGCRLCAGVLHGAPRLTGRPRAPPAGKLDGRDASPGAGPGGRQEALLGGRDGEAVPSPGQTRPHLGRDRQPPALCQDDTRRGALSRRPSPPFHCRAGQPGASGSARVPESWTLLSQHLDVGSAGGTGSGSRNPG